MPAVLVQVRGRVALVWFARGWPVAQHRLLRSLSPPQLGDLCPWVETSRAARGAHLRASALCHRAACLSLRRHRVALITIAAQGVLKPECESALSHQFGFMLYISL